MDLQFCVQVSGFVVIVPILMYYGASIAYPRHSFFCPFRRMLFHLQVYSQRIDALVRIEKMTILMTASSCLIYSWLYRAGSSAGLDHFELSLEWRWHVPRSWWWPLDTWWSVSREVVCLKRWFPLRVEIAFLLCHAPVRFGFCPGLMANLQSMHPTGMSTVASCSFLIPDCSFDLWKARIRLLLEIIT